jgi:acyl-CoA-binding protein
LIFGTYAALLKQGWTMTDIDQMDIFGYWRVRAWEQRKGKPAQDDGPVYIDDLF